jgi:hypothetical protein
MEGMSNNRKRHATAERRMTEERLSIEERQASK